MRSELTVLEWWEPIVMYQVQGRLNYFEAWDLALLGQGMSVPACTGTWSRGNIGGLQR